MATTTSSPFRVVCAEWTQELPTLDRANRWLIAAETAGHCMYEHTVEARDDQGHWHPLYVWLTIQVTQASLGDRVDTGDGPLTKASGGWSDTAVARADAAAEPSSATWYALIGSHTRTTLSADGREVNTTGWCRCSPEPGADSWVRYERWEAEQRTGRVAHGYACRSCRKVLQSG